ncbi:MAG: HAD hydrolase family protein [Rhodobacteraceae bacterium]|nr:HAD hydrolase family protein [Paracoccaceae bacterium]
MKRLIMDLDNTLTRGETSDYRNIPPNVDVIRALRHYREEGFEIVISTARGMRTYDRNVGKINIHTVPVILAWLTRHGVPFDELVVGKPWCGHQGFCVDDRTVRPDEFATMTHAQIRQLLGLGK